jgi:hypothetical protein
MVLKLKTFTINCKLQTRKEKPSYEAIFALYDGFSFSPPETFPFYEVSAEFGANWDEEINHG